MKVWMVLPAYNESGNLTPLFEECKKIISEGINLSLVVVDDGSTDNTSEVTRSFQDQLDIELLVNDPNRGLGYTFKRGLLRAVEKASDEDIIVAMDADNTHLPEQIHEVIKRIQEGYDVVAVSRYRKGATIKGVSLYRRFLSRGMGVLFQVVYPIRGIRDYSCGFRGYKANTLKKAYEAQGDKLFYEEGFSCMVGLLIRLHKAGAKFSEVPLNLRYDQKIGPSKMPVGNTVFTTLKLLAKERFSGI